MRTTAAARAQHDDFHLSRYFRDISQAPILTAAEELDLARRWFDGQDRMAAQALVTSHLRIAMKLAVKYRGYGFPVADLVAEGNVGLLRALDRFDPGRGFRFNTYAQWWIRFTIQDFIMKYWSLVKMGTTPAQKKLFFRLRRTYAQLEALGCRSHDELIGKIAVNLKVSAGEVASMYQRMAAPDQSLNIVQDEETGAELLNSVPDTAPSQEADLGDRQEQALRRSLLRTALDSLSERERRVLSARRLQERPAKLAQLAAELGVSPERIRQIEGTAFTKLQAQVRVLAKARSMEMLVKAEQRGLPHSETRASGTPSAVAGNAVVADSDVRYEIRGIDAPRSPRPMFHPPAAQRAHYVRAAAPF